MPMSAPFKQPSRQYLAQALLAAAAATAYLAATGVSFAGESPAAEPAAVENLPALPGVAKLDGEGLKLRAELRDLIVAKKLTPNDVRKPNVGPVLLQIASSAEPATVVAPAMNALTVAYALPGSKSELPSLDNKVRDVALARLSAPQDKVRYASMQVLAKFLMRDPVDAAVRERLLAVFRKPGAGQAERFDALLAVTTMAGVKQLRQPVYAEMLMEAATAPELPVRLLAMQRLVSLQGLVGKEVDAKVIPKLAEVWQLGLKAKAPEIRGAAAHGLLGLAESVAPDSQVYAAALAALCDDPLPSVRAAGAVAVGNLKIASHAAKLALLLDDPASARVALSGFLNLNGIPASINFGIYNIESPNQVRHYAALALVMFSGGGTLPMLELPALESDGTEEGDNKAVEARISVAKAWYAQHKALIK